MKIDRHHSDLQGQVNLLRRDIDEEKAGRREWVLRRAEIDSQLEQLRKGPLAGIHINGRRPTDRSLEATSDIDSDFNFPSSISMEDNVGMFGVFHSSGSTSTTEFKIDGFNGFDPTYDALMFNPRFDRPELRGNLSMGTDHFNPAGTDQMDSLPPLPMPASTPPSIMCSTLPIELEIQLQRRQRAREPEVNQANIIEGARPRNKSRRARGEA
ncbi:hypothetical protein K438DRAFT_1759531 [Mycena galopus ATCC 62051]|nr:hypothetical protein K438DRAFT_1759531 [Mycena galopus ATCC 62051]